MLYVSFLRAVPGGYRCVQHCVNCIGNGLNITVIDLYVIVLHFYFKSTSAVSKKECTCWNKRKNNRVRFLLAGRPRPSQHFTSASTSTGISKMPAKLTLFHKNTFPPRCAVDSVLKTMCKYCALRAAGGDRTSASHCSVDSALLWMWEISTMGLSSWKASWM